MIIEHNSGWQKEDGQYYDQLLNGNRVLNGTYRGKVLGVTRISYSFGR